MSMYTVLARRMSLFLIIVCVSACAGPSPETQEDQSIDRVQLGEVDFPISCDDAAQSQFTEAVSLLHSFQFEAAIQAFRQVAAIDENCGLAYWGIAASYAPVVWGPAYMEFEPGSAAIQKALDIGGGTEREAAFIDALAALYKGIDGLDHDIGLRDYVSHMASLHSRFPDDREVALFYATALLATVDTADTTYEIQRRAGEIVEVVFDEQPNHPGAAHYVIHAYDYPELATLALPAARRYAEIAPSAPHALHMPSHIFSRLGLWDESIDSNVASHATAAANDDYSGVVHAIDYSVYARLQRGQDAAAARLVDELLVAGDADSSNYDVLGHIADIKARDVFERRAWAEATALDLEPNLGQFARFESTVLFARAVGLARSGDAAAARRDAARLLTLQSEMSEAGEDYYAAKSAIWHGVTDAWIHQAESEPDRALELMRAVVELDDATIHVGSFESGPDTLVQTHEQLGDLLLELQRPAEALQEYKRSLDTSPNRLNALYGAARAAELAGESDLANGYYRQLVALVGESNSEREAVQKAKAFLQNRES